VPLLHVGREVGLGQPRRLLPALLAHVDLDRVGRVEAPGVVGLPREHRGVGEHVGEDLHLVREPLLVAIAAGLDPAAEPLGVRRPVFR
jgi:hypothetical protein